MGFRGALKTYLANIKEFIKTLARRYKFFWKTVQKLFVPYRVYIFNTSGLNTDGQPASGGGVQNLDHRPLLWCHPGCCVLYHHQFCESCLYLSSSTIIIMNYPGSKLYMK